jgi:hypothetical protein
MGEACSVHGGNEMHIPIKFLLESLKVRNPSEDIGVYGRII